MRTLRIPVTPPFAAGAVLAALRAHTVVGYERHDAAGATHVRAVRTPTGASAVSVTLGAPDHVTVRVDTDDTRSVAEPDELVRSWLDLDADPAVDATLRTDTLLAPLVAARPGLRVLGSTDWFATAVQTVLGQQVSVAAGCTFTARLVGAYGDPAPQGLKCFPPPGRLAHSDVGELRAAVGLTASRARTVRELARVADGGLDPTRSDFRAALLAVPGIGPWTVDHLSLRVLGDRDAFPSGDLVLRRALGIDDPRAAVARAEPWRPWRAYAVSHLWTHAAYAPSSSVDSPPTPPSPNARE